MSAHARISTRIAASTKRELDEYAEAHGLKRGYLLEEALRHHLRGLRELPTDVFIPTRVVVTRQSGERILEGDKALRELFRKR